MLEQDHRILRIREVMHLLQTEEIIAPRAVVEQEITVLEIVLALIENLAALLHREVATTLDHLLQEVVAIKHLLQEAAVAVVDHHLNQARHLQEVVDQDVQIDKKK